jgi:hypothetical protein
VTPVTARTAAAVRPDRLEADLARLASLDQTSLSRRWRMVFGRAAPEHLSRPLLHRMLAYRVQADALGDLDRDTIRMLARLGSGQGGNIPPPESPGTKPGTLLVREWQGVLQRVMMMEQGFAWNGETYDSLTKVAFAITGTAWNGPRFFGLRQKKSTTGARP